MLRNKVKFALIFRVAALIFSISGVLAVTGVLNGRANTGSLYYYTTQSNIMAVVMFTLLTAGTLRKVREGGDACCFQRFSMICVIDILVTFFVFWILLVPTMGGRSLRTFANLSVHAVTPMLCLLDYILFTKPRHLKYRDVYAVVVYPLCYVAFATAAGFAGHTYGTGSDGAPVRFPYFFTDYDRLGAYVAAYVAVLAVIFIILSHGFYIADSKIRK